MRWPRRVAAMESGAQAASKSSHPGEILASRLKSGHRLKGRNARNHGFARNRQFRPARRRARTAAVGRRRPGAHAARSGYARPIAKSSAAPTAPRLPGRGASSSAMSRWARWKSAPAGLRGRARRSRRRHRPPARSAAVPGLRRRRMGHVPQRRLHRTRHQGAARLRRRAFSHRAGIRGQDRSGPGYPGRAAGACQHPGQGVGSHRAHRPARPRMAAAEPAGHRRGPDRPARRPDGTTARARRARARPQQGRPEGSDRARSRRRLSFRREHPRTPRSRRPDGMHRRRRRDPRLPRRRGARRNRLPHRRYRAGQDIRPRYRPSQPQDGARQRDRIRHA